MSRKYKFRSQDDLYFISTATINWIDVFTRPLYKDIVVESLRYCQREKDLDIDAWCLMTNHLHIIIGTRSRKMEHTLRDHPIAVFTPAVLLQKLHYIHQNPVVAGFVERPEEWLYSSAKNYYSTDLPLLDVLLIE